MQCVLGFLYNSPFFMCCKAVVKAITNIYVKTYIFVIALNSIQDQAVNFKYLFYQNYFIIVLKYILSTITFYDIRWFTFFGNFFTVLYFQNIYLISSFRGCQEPLSYSYLFITKKQEGKDVTFWFFKKDGARNFLFLF